MHCFAGIDIGASTTKAIILDENHQVLGHSVVNSGASFEKAADLAFSQARQIAKLDNAEKCVVTSTGYGRRNVPYADDTRTEISCHAAGSFHHFPSAQTLIDIGGQDNKVIMIDDTGKRISFKMNRKCAAGTGAFLEEMANRLKIEMKQLNELALCATHHIEIGSYCTVFTGTEILARIREGASVEDIVKGVFTSVIKRIEEMASMNGKIVMTGGVVAHNPFIVEMFEERIGIKIDVPPLPQLTGALGAALHSHTIEGGQDA
jgi:predicted CoA-substrate-specific enzyme activase